jgi:flagellar P-ring protein precursor FlgI
VNGAIVEKEALSGILDKDGRLSLLLRAPDFTTASRIADAINAVFAGVAEAVDASCIKVLVPEEERKNIIGFVAKIEAINVVPDSAAKVVINERTATIVMGENLRVDEVVVTHKNLTLMVREDEKIRKERTFLMKEGVTLKDVVDALNAIGASPQDIIAIIQAIKEAGALHAQIILM